MLGNLVACAFLLLAIVVGLRFSNAYVPDTFERPFAIRLASTISSFMCQLCKFAAYLGIGKEAALIRRLADLQGTRENKDENVSMNDVIIGGVKSRVYRPKTEQSKNIENDLSLPIMIYYHGGGFFFKSINMYELMIFEIVKRLNMVVVSVDYRYAPEHPFPQPTEDCYTVTKYILANPDEFRANVSRLVLAGDSAGGNAVAVITQRLLKENTTTMPKLQVMLYPWTQLFDFNLPSHRFYNDKDIGGVHRTSLFKVALWYLGFTDVTHQIEDVFARNELYALIEDKSELDRLADCMDVSKISAEYRPINYYDKSRRRIETKLVEDSILRRDKRLAEIIKKLLDPKVSPLVAQKQDLVGLPKAYIVTLEWDSLKDESILYAQRLKEAGVDVRVAFYERAFHGIAPFLNQYTTSHVILADLVEYLRSNL